MRRIQSKDVRDLIFNDQQDLQPIQLSKSDKFLMQIFSHLYAPGESIQTFRQEIRDHRRYLMSTNLHNYQYSRAHHHHFYLGDFPRIPNQPTYALDYNNSFRSTFSHEHKLYKGDRLDSIINRVAFTCPKAQQHYDYFGQRKKGRTHNRAHDQLFSVENSKIVLDRQLLTCRKLLQNLQKLSLNYCLWQFQLIKKQPELAFLLEDTIDLEYKRKKLQQHVKKLEQRKINCTPYWQANDDIFLYSSFQQKLHDRVDQQESLEIVQGSNRVQFLINKYKHSVEALSNPQTDLDAILAKLFTYYHTKQSALSLPELERLKSNIQKINKPSKTTLPLLIFNFGKLKLREKVNHIIARFMMNKQLQSEDQVIATLIRLFRGRYQSYQHVEELSAYQAKRAVKFERDSIKKCVQSQKQRINQAFLLDESINQRAMDQSTAERDEALPILTHSDYKIQIGEEQIRILFYYKAVCSTIALFQPYIHQQNNLMNILCSPFLDHLLHGIIGHIPNKAIGQLENNLKHLVQHAILQNFVKQTDIITHFYWEFNKDTGIGILWNLQKKPSQGKDLSHFYNKMLNQKASEQASSQVKADENAQQKYQQSMRKIIKQNEEQD